MAYSIHAIPRWIRRRMKKTVQTTRDKDYARRLQAVLLLWSGYSVTTTAECVSAARSTVQRWRALYEEYGEAGLKPQARGRRPWTVTEALQAKLVELLNDSPQAFGYLRSRWSSELLALVLQAQFSFVVHPSTLRRLLPKCEFVWRRPRPFLNRRDPRKNAKLRAIRRALKHRSAQSEVFYVDEADVDFNPRLGPMLMRRGQQAGVLTPGKNQKHYLAGALNAHTGRVVWCEHPTKDSTLFLSLLDAVKRTYRAAKELVLILDNYIIHKSEAVQRYLSQHRKFTFLFQPTYSPWENKIERLWKVMHDTVTRNHQCKNFPELAQHIIRFMAVVQPFPGNEHGLATLWE